MHEVRAVVSEGERSAASGTSSLWPAGGGAFRALPRHARGFRLCPDYLSYREHLGDSPPAGNLRRPQRGRACVEICAGAGGQAYGLELAGFRHLALVESDESCCRTLRERPRWRKVVREVDVHEWRAVKFEGVDLFAARSSLPPILAPGLRLGARDERDLFPRAIELIAECKPRAVLSRTSAVSSGSRFEGYRSANRWTAQGAGIQAIMDASERVGLRRPAGTPASHHGRTPPRRRRRPLVGLAHTKIRHPRLARL